MSRKAPIAAAAVLLLIATPAASGQLPRPGSTDPRIQTVAYDPAEVVTLRGAYGYQMMLEFGPDERIENVSIGDALAWQVTPNKRANLLFLKPIANNASTNMTVVTDRRRYAFELTAGRPSASRSGEIPYVVRFTYPPEEAPVLAETVELAAPERRNTAYSYTGSRAALPSLVFDDGAFTYFEWPDGASTPALFLLAADGAESLVNYGVRDGYLVVEQVAPRFILRNGKEVTTLINDGWREPALGTEAPRPADAKTAREAVRAGALR